MDTTSTSAADPRRMNDVFAPTTQGGVNWKPQAVNTQGHPHDAPRGNDHVKDIGRFAT